jgi:L-amino acid N-acyltransferase YncA
MLWKLRTELADRPGALARLAARCGANDLNILSLEVFTAETGAIDELVVSTGVGWTADDLITLAAEAGCTGTTVSPCQAEVLSDAPTRYLRAVLRLIDDPHAVAEEVERLQGFDEYTPAEWARANVLVEIAGWLTELYDGVQDGPRPGSVVPELRKATVDDADAVVAMHERCSYASRLRRYHAPIPKLTLRTARQMTAPAGGVSIVACAGDSVVGIATAAPWEEISSDDTTVMEMAVLVEDGWQRQGLGTALLAQVIREARLLGADRAVCMVQPDNTAMLRTVEALRVRTRVVQNGGHLMVTVALSDQSLSHAVDRAPVEYRQTRAITAHHRRPSTAQSAGTTAGDRAIAGVAVVPAVPDRTGPARPDGTDRGGRP